MICNDCLDKIAFPIDNHSFYKNKLEEKLVGKVEFHDAISLSIFSTSSPIRTLLHEFKYNSNIKAGKLLKYFIHRDTLNRDAFIDIDYIIPVPIGKRKLNKRGYNQAELISEWISKDFNIPILTNALFRKDSISQTSQIRYNRFKKLEGVYCKGDMIKKIENKNVLLIDDVITTGATVERCGTILSENKAKNISFLFLAQAI